MGPDRKVPSRGRDDHRLPLPKGGSSFRIEGVPFGLLNRSVGLTGQFNVPRDAQGELRDGLRVRLAHRDGFILRVEIDSGQGGLAAGPGN